MAEYDKSSKWLIQHHGDSILRLAQVRDIESWRALQAELVQPRQLPDGLLEARIRGQADAHLFLVEVATYPERRLVEQVFGDAALAWLNRRVLPVLKKGSGTFCAQHPSGRSGKMYLTPFSKRRVKSRQSIRQTCRVRWVGPTGRRDGGS